MKGTTTLSVRKEVHHRVPVTIDGVLEWQRRPGEDDEEDDRRFFNDPAARVSLSPYDANNFLGYVVVKAVEIDRDEHKEEEAP